MKPRHAVQGINRFAERLSGAVTRWAGGTIAFAAALLLIVLWLVSGPVFHFSDTWQLVINTTTTIVTFLMVFLIQRAQNKDARAASLKLNELIAAIEGASNRLVDVEDLSEEELVTLHKHFRRLVEMSKRDSSLMRSHSVEEAAARHEVKQAGHGSRRAGRRSRGRSRGTTSAAKGPSATAKAQTTTARAHTTTAKAQPS
jgi:low affinity Fe/Cu permease